MSPLTDIIQFGYVRSTNGGTFTDATLRIGKTNVSKTDCTEAISSFPYELPARWPSSLLPNTKYYYRVYAINAQHDTAYGAVKYFTTESDAKSCKNSIGSSYPDNITDASSNSYLTVGVGSQCWLGSNMRITKYADGMALASGTYKTSSGGLTNYGYLYSYEAAMRGTYKSTGNVQGICPAGWHMPSAAEVTTMKTTMEGTTDYQCESTSANIARAMASKSGWKTSSVTCTPGYNLSENNASGFNLYPTGYVNGSSASSYKEATYLWNAGTVSYYGISYSASALGIWNGFNKDWYFPVRCVYGSNYAPAVATNEGTDLSIKTVTLYGIVNSAGTGSTVTERGFCYSSTNDDPTISDTKVVASGTGTGVFSVNVTGLTANTTYHWRAYATNSNGTSYGEVKSFKTLTGKTVSNYSSSNVTKTSMKLKGSISNGSATGETVQKWGFLLYKKDANGTFTYILDAYDDDLNSHTQTGMDSRSYTFQLVDTAQTGQYSMTISGLESGATYKYKAQVKTNLQNWIYASAMSNSEITTLADPVLTMDSIIYHGSGNTFTYYGTIVNAGNPNYTERGFVYSQSNTTPTISDAHISASGTGTGSFNRNDSWSGPGVTRYMRAYAKKSDGTYVYSSQTKSFTTPNPPTMGFTGNYELPYNYSTNVTKNSIKLETTWTSNGGAALTGRGLLYTTNSSMAAPTSSNISTNASDAATKWVKVPSTSATERVVTLTGLSSNTTYYIKSYGTNPFGTGYSSATKTVKTQIDCSVGSSSSAARKLKDINGNEYETVKIGSYCWTKTNMKATIYDNASGTSITLKTSGGSANMSTTARYMYYPKHMSSNYSTYGYLYNWPAAAGYGVTNSPTGSNMTTSQGKVQGICPRGWHLPTREEINNMRSYAQEIPDIITGTFGAQYAGSIKGDDGTYESFGSRGYYYTSTDAYTSNPGNHYYHFTVYNDGTHTMGWTTYAYANAFARSVRCVQDITY